MREEYAPLPAIGGIVLLYLLWAALHDICQANENGYTLEYAFVALSIPGFALVYWRAFRVLTRRGRAVWLAVTCAALCLLNLSAASARFSPKYPNDAAVGAAFLCVGLPLLAIAAWKLMRVRQAA